MRTQFWFLLFHSCGFYSKERLMPILFLIIFAILLDKLISDRFWKFHWNQSNDCQNIAKVSIAEMAPTGPAFCIVKKFKFWTVMCARFGAGKAFIFGSTCTHRARTDARRDVVVNRSWRINFCTSSNKPKVGRPRSQPLPTTAAILGWSVYIHTCILRML